MLVVMEPGADSGQLLAVIDRLESSGTVHAQVINGEDRDVVAAIGDPEGVLELGLEALPGVEKLVPISAPYKLASRQVGGPQPVVVGETEIGRDFTLIAGPCTVENYEQTLNVAEAAKDAGAKLLRGGAFKPRTSPFAFQGLGQEGLDILARVSEETGLGVVTEVTEAKYIDAVAEVASVMQIGARNMQNYGLLAAVGETGKPVLLKRGLSASLDELLQAADYILKSGSENVILCERGIRTFETATRFTLDLGGVAWLKIHSRLPVIVDPSHAAGRRDLVLPLSRAAAAVGADGIIVEVAPNPAEALCDAAQQVSSANIGSLAQSVFAHAALVEKERGDEPSHPL